MIGTSVIKELRRSSLIILRKFLLTRCKAKFAFFVSLSGFSSTNIHNLQDTRCKGKLSLYILCITFTRFSGSQILTRLLLKRAHLCTQLAAGLKQEPLVSKSKSLTTKPHALQSLPFLQMHWQLLFLGECLKLR